MTPKLFARLVVVTLVLAIIPVVPAMAQTSTSAVGTATAVHAESGSIDFKPDKGEAVQLRVTQETLLQRVAPGATDLKSAQPTALTDINAGDRLLVTLKAGTTEARRVVVIAASDIKKRNDADRADWIKRGITGVVAEKKGNDIVLRMRMLMGESRATVTVSEETVCRRYAPDSVKFADARPSTVAEVSVGDQLRARGQKSEDGSSVTADELVFGTFVTKAGSVLNVDNTEKQITVKDPVTNKHLVIKIAADSQIRRLPQIAAGMLAAMTGGTAAGASGAAQKAPGPAGAGTASGTGSAQKAPAPGATGTPAGAAQAMAAARSLDINQLLERMPAAKLEEFKPGETVIVSSTKGAKSDQVTAIVLLGNADPLIQLVQMTSGANRPDALSMALAGSAAGGGTLQMIGIQ